MQPASTASGISDSVLMVDLLTIAWVKIDTRAAIQQYRVTLLSSVTGEDNLLLHVGVCM